MNESNSNKVEINVVDRPELMRLRFLYVVDVFLIAVLFVMPQYFGVHLGWDITCSRFANIILIIYGFLNIFVFNMFSQLVFRVKATIPLVFYLLVAMYTMLLRTDINAFMLVFLEILTFYLVLFSVRYVIGVKKSIKLIRFCAYFLGVYGILEFVAGHSLYLQFLRTMPTQVTNCYRSGYYRIMGPCGHPLAYGLLLLLFIAIACIDIDKDKIDLLKNPLLFLLLIINVFLTGSRSSQGIAAVEIVVLFFMQDRNTKKRNAFYFVVTIVCVGLFLLLGSKTRIGHYLLMQIATLFDQVLGTSFSAKLGVDISTLNNSEEYRKYLPKIFTIDWLNPFVGRGTKGFYGVEIITDAGNSIYIHSIDNYFVSQYIKYAYPGLVSYCLFILTTLVYMIRNSIKYKSGILKALMIGACCYFINLWWLDALQTLKFAYVIIAVFFALSMVYEDADKQRMNLESVDI